MRHFRNLTLLLLLLVLPWWALRSTVWTSRRTATPSSSLRRPHGPLSVADKIVLAARKQAKEGTSYVPGYVVIDYPGGDVPRDQGVCTDVIVRSLRAVGYDLQKLIHEDMKAHFNAYPRHWGLRRPDTNIDHRRVPNQMTFFRRRGRTLTTVFGRRTQSQWKAGDLVYWDLGYKGFLHCGVVSDKREGGGVPSVIHNLGGCREESVLLAWKIIGHYRYPVE